MWFDDLILCKELQHKYELQPPFVECGGIPDPVIADYSRTIAAMARFRPDERLPYNAEVATPEKLRDAQMCRYLQIHRPLSFLDPEYALEDPSVGGLPIERLAEKYNARAGSGIGTAILLSVLEHVADPFEAIDRLRDAMAPGGIAIVSVPFCFPEHPSPEDCWRFTPTALRYVFSPPKGSDEPARWQILDCSWRLRLGADQGVLDVKTMRPHAVESCYLVARAC